MRAVVFHIMKFLHTCIPTENKLYLSTVYYVKMNVVYHCYTTVNYSEFGQFIIVLSIVLYSRTMLNYGNFLTMNCAQKYIIFS